MCVCLLLGACAPNGPGEILDAYNTRLARVLAQDLPQVSAHRIPKLPAVRELRIEFPRETVNLFEFLQLRDCALGQLVAARNSSLGIMAKPSQRLVYELNFLRVGGQCVDLIRKDHPELAASLAKVIAHKREQLPRMIWQATLGGEEFRSFWQFGSGALPERFDSDGSLLLALKQLDEEIASWLDGDYRVDAEQLESQLDRIRHGQGGVLLRAWMTLSNNLDVASQVLADRQSRRPLCFKGMHPHVADIFDTVVKELFIRKIQAWAARLSARSFQLFPAVRKVEDRLTAAEPPAYANWRKQRDARLVYANEALVRHVKVLKPLLSQCKLIPQGFGD